MLAVRLTVPVFIEITTPTPDPEAALLRARAFLREQLQRIAAVDGSAWMDRELGDVVRAWTAGVAETRSEFVEVPDLEDADDEEGDEEPHQGAEDAILPAAPASAVRRGRLALVTGGR